MKKGDKATLVSGFSNPLGKWKNGDPVTIKEIFEEFVTVEEFLGEVSKKEIQVIQSNMSYENINH